MALIKNKLSSIENEVIKSANEQIELKQKDHFKHFQRLNRTMIEYFNKHRLDIDEIKEEILECSDRMYRNQQTNHNDLKMLIAMWHIISMIILGIIVYQLN